MCLKRILQISLNVQKVILGGLFLNRAGNLQEANFLQNLDVARDSDKKDNAFCCVIQADEVKKFLEELGSPFH